MNTRTIFDMLEPQDLPGYPGDEKWRAMQMDIADLVLNPDIEGLVLCPTIVCNPPSGAAGVRPNLSRLTNRCTPQIEYTRQVTDDLISFEEYDDAVLSDLVAAFYRRHRRACITISKFAGRPVAHGLFLASLPF